MINYSKITDDLYVGTTPKAADYEVLHSLGVKLVINMRIGLPPVRDQLSPPLQSLWIPTIDSPLTPIPIRALQKGATAALKVIDRGGVVYTHCSHGRHRGPVMGACILIAQGMEAEQAVQLVEQQRPQAELHVGYIQQRIIKFAHKWGATG